MRRTGGTVAAMVALAAMAGGEAAQAQSVTQAELVKAAQQAGFCRISGVLSVDTVTGNRPRIRCVNPTEAAGGPGAGGGAGAAAFGGGMAGVVAGGGLLALLALLGFGSSTTKGQK